MKYKMIKDTEFDKTFSSSDFKLFVQFVFSEVAPNSKYLDNWHIDVICNELLNVKEGKQNKLIINIPPRYMKSIICSIAFPAFILGHNPEASIIVVSYSDELSTKLASDCKRIIECTWYQELFPGTRLSKSKKATNDFETTKGGGRYATSVGGTLTGRGGDYIIIDDPIKPIEAITGPVREKTNEWYGNTLYSRLNDKNNGKIIVIMQRVHENDLTGYLLNLDFTYKHVKIPAIAEENEKWVITERLIGKKKVFKRKKGEALHPERENLEKLNEAKRNMGIDFAGQYQQNPMPREGGIIEKEWLQFYDKKELFKAIEKGEIEINYLIQSWDTAIKDGQLNDYSVCITILRDSTGINYVMNVFRKRLKFPGLLKEVVSRYNAEKEKYNYNRDIILLIEDKNSGTGVIQKLDEQYGILAKDINPIKGKETRLSLASLPIKDGECLFPNDAPYWWMDFEDELLRFPRVTHDDQCDALSQALLFKNTYEFFMQTIKVDRSSRSTDDYMNGFNPDINNY